MSRPACPPTPAIKTLIKEGALSLDFEDEIIGGTCITHGGQVVHEATQRALPGGSSG
jgi:NAD(P) transhydrogenase subunit alpha